MGDDLSEYEPESTWDSDEAMDTFMAYIPETFIQRLRDRVLRRKR